MVPAPEGRVPPPSPLVGPASSVDHRLRCPADRTFHNTNYHDIALIILPYQWLSQAVRL